MADQLEKCPNCSEVLTSGKYCFTCKSYPLGRSPSRVTGSSAQPTEEFPPSSRIVPKFSDTKSFFAVLFNWKFQDFIFIRVARVLYLLLLILSALTVLYYEIAIQNKFLTGLNDANSYGEGDMYLQSQFWPFIVSVVGLPILYLLEVIILRMLIETGVAVIKIAENTSKEQ